MAEWPRSYIVSASSSSVLPDRHCLNLVHLLLLAASSHRSAHVSCIDRRGRRLLPLQPTARSPPFLTVPCSDCDPCYLSFEAAPLYRHDVSSLALVPLPCVPAVAPYPASVALAEVHRPSQLEDPASHSKHSAAPKRPKTAHCLLLPCSVVPLLLRARAVAFFSPRHPRSGARYPVVGARRC